MITELLLIKKIGVDMNDEQEEQAMSHNRKLKSIINQRLRQEFLTAKDGKEFIELRKYIEHELNINKYDVDEEQVLDKLNTMFDAEEVRSKFKFIKCEWCNRYFNDKNGRGKYLLHQHQTRGKNAGKCVYLYIKNKLKTMTQNDALDLKEYIDELEEE